MYVKLFRSIAEAFRFFSEIEPNFSSLNRIANDLIFSAHNKSGSLIEINAHEIGVIVFFYNVLVQSVITLCNSPYSYEIIPKIKYANYVQ